MYSFYFDKMLLPITPKKLTLKIKGNNKTVALINESELNFLRLPKLTEITFDMVLPMLGPYSFSRDFHRPDYYLSILEKYMTERKPFRFIVSRVSPSGELLFDNNMQVSLESYSLVESATDGFDVTVSVTLKQFIDFKTKTVEVKTVVTKAAAKPEEKKVATSTTKRPTSEEKPKGKTYTVKKGDCLWAIAQACMGNGNKYPQLYEANKSVIDPVNKKYGYPKYTIFAGQVFTIP